MTTTTEHKITVTDLGEERVRVTCSCNGFSHETRATLAKISFGVHVNEVTRPNVARAYDINNVILNAAYRGELTRDQAIHITQAVLLAADVADKVETASSRKRAIEHLVKLVRGEAVRGDTRDATGGDQ